MQPQRHEPKSIAWGWVEVDPTLAPHLDSAVQLSAFDAARAHRFRRDEDRVRFMAGRGLLTALLRRTGETPPGELALTEHGRPYFPGRPDLAFSISHAGRVVAVALTLGARVGLDVETPDRQIDLAALAGRIFNPADLTRFRALPTALQTRAFFHAWTGKEAVLKARGLGLFGGLEEIAAPLDGHAATLISGDITWHLHPLPLPHGYVGCLACDDPPRPLVQHAFQLADLA